MPRSFMSVLLSYLASIGVVMGAAYVILHWALQPDLAQATTQAARPVPEIPIGRSLR